jgi:hypothetical protein
MLFRRKLFLRVLLLFLTNQLASHSYWGDLFLPIKSKDYESLRTFSEQLRLHQYAPIKAALQTWIQELKAIPTRINFIEDTSTINALIYNANYELSQYDLQDSVWFYNINKLSIRLEKLLKKKKFNEEEATYLLWCKASHLNVLYKEQWFLFPLCGISDGCIEQLIPAVYDDYSIYLDSINFAPLGSKYRNDTLLVESMYKVWHLNFISLRNFWDATFLKEKKHFFDFHAPVKKENLIEAETFKDLFYKAESGEYILIYIHHNRGT